jgi:hypothetical protein
VQRAIEIRTAFSSKCDVGLDCASEFFPELATDSLASHVRRIAYKRMKTTAAEDFRKLYRPMKGAPSLWRWRRAFAPPRLNNRQSRFAWR